MIALFDHCGSDAPPAGPREDRRSSPRTRL